MKTLAQFQAPVLELLKQLSPDSSTNTLRSWIEKGRVQVAGKVVKRSSQQVLAGQEVVVGPRVQFERSDIKILFEDEHLVVLEKPHRLLSVATDFQDQYTVHAILKRRRHPGRVFPVHRLDKDTSGIMLFAYSEEARDRIKEQFEKRSVDKLYIAFVEGKMQEKKGTWESFLEEDENFFVSSTHSEKQGKLAVTFFEVIAQNRSYSSLQLKPQTGRKNQLRVHCSEAGFPIVGDKKYGAQTNPIKRLCLHAQAIAFNHPISGKRMSFSVPVPDEFQKIIK